MTVCGMAGGRVRVPCDPRPHAPKSRAASARERALGHVRSEILMVWGRVISVHIEYIVYID